MFRQPRWWFSVSTISNTSCRANLALKPAYNTEPVAVRYADVSAILSHYDIYEAGLPIRSHQGSHRARAAARDSFFMHRGRILPQLVV